MKSNILVPIIGSRDVQSIVPLLQSMLDGGGVGKVTLVRVVPLAPAAALDFPLETADVMAVDASRREEAEALLSMVAGKIVWGHAKHEIVALQGTEAETLERFAAGERFDSVLMVSRKRSWFGRLFSAGLADRILAAVRVPITLLPGPDCIAHRI